MHTGTSPDQKHLQRYVAERLPQLVPGIFDGAPDYPSFTVDQRYIPPQELPYSVG
jgi:hypothetical protein